MPCHEFEELSMQSEIAKELIGKKAGDPFVLAKSPIRDRVGTITQILTKYTRRFQAIGDQMELKFGDQTVIRTMRVPPPEKLTAADMQPMLDSVKTRSEAVLQVRELYKSIPVTLHMYADQFGNTAYGGQFSRRCDVHSCNEERGCYRSCDSRYTPTSRSNATNPNERGLPIRPLRSNIYRFR
jgi:hypothetical protein